MCYKLYTTRCVTRFTTRCVTHFTTRCFWSRWKTPVIRSCCYFCHEKLQELAGHWELQSVISWFKQGTRMGSVLFLCTPLTCWLEKSGCCASFPWSSVQRYTPFKTNLVGTSEALLRPSAVRCHKWEKGGRFPHTGSPELYQSSLQRVYTQIWE